MDFWVVSGTKNHQFTVEIYYERELSEINTI